MLTGNEELAAAEERYLPTQDAGCKAIVLAASRGAALGKLTDDKPKCMIDVRGQPLLRRQVAMLNESGVQDVIIVRGYKKDAIDLPSVGTRDNDEFADTKELYSLACAREDLDGPCLVTYGDILFRPYMLDALLRAEGDIVIVADALWRDREQSAEGLVRDLIVADRAFTTNFLDDALVNLSAAGHGISPKDATGEWVGMLKLSKAGAAAVHVELDAMDADGLLRDAEIPDLLNRMMAAGHKVQVQYITGQWLDVDDVHDLAQARNIT